MKSSKMENEIIEVVKIGWGDLHFDLLHQIFRLLPVENLMRSISCVCRQWRLVCGTVIFWKDYQTLDLSPLNMMFSCHFKQKNPLACHLIRVCHFKHDLHMQQVLKFALNCQKEYGLRCIRAIIFSPCKHADDKHLNDNHLAFLAERSLKLKKLVLPDLCNITIEGFSKIMKTWRELEELSLGLLGHTYLNLFFPILGKTCGNLTTLHIFGLFSLDPTVSFNLDEKNALIIAKNLQKLRVFTIDKVYLHKSGVSTLLSKSNNLVELNLKGCRKELKISPNIGILEAIAIFENDILVEISREIKRCRLKNCLKWYIASSSEDHMIMYTAEELANGLWAN